MTVGFTLGKFAPLHRGHQLVIETMLREMDRVLVLIYPAAETTVPLSVRAQWIRALYPRVEVIEAWEGPEATGYTPEIMEAQEMYLKRILDGRGVTHFYSSEPYGEHVSRALGTIDRRVDPERTIVPASARAIRDNPYAHRHLIDPLVYRDLVVRVVFLGAMSTGKTTICTALAERYQTVWMPEYGREYWEQHHVERRLTLEELVHIADEHRRREDEMVLEANRVLFVDTEAIVTRLFSVYYHGRADERLERFADEVRDRYDLFFLCEDDIPYADTPDRSGEANRELFQMWIRDELSRRKIPYVTLRGSLEERVALATRVIDGYEKYRNVGDWLL